MVAGSLLSRRHHEHDDIAAKTREMQGVNTITQFADNTGAEREAKGSRAPPLRSSHEQ